MATILKWYKPLFPLRHRKTVAFVAKAFHCKTRFRFRTFPAINWSCKSQSLTTCCEENTGKNLAAGDDNCGGNSREIRSELWLHNTMSKQRELFKPKVQGKVGMYVCGVTAYDLSHIGHARVYVSFDVLYRYLKYLGYEVNYVRNFTDVDDKDT